MNLFILFLLFATLSNSVKSAPYVQHMDHDRESPITVQEQEQPQRTKVNANKNLLKELFGFMDVLMDPENYGNNDEAQVLKSGYFAPFLFFFKIKM